MSFQQVLVAVAIVAVIGACTSSDDSADEAESPTATAHDATTTTAAAARPVVISAEDLRAMTLPQSELGASYAGLTFDWFFGGFEDNEERARDKSDAPEEERKDLAETGRLVGYQSMYVPPEPPAGQPPPPGVQRVFTLAHLFRDSAGALAYLRDSTEEARQEVGKTPAGDAPRITAREEFPVEDIGEEAIGSVSKGSAGNATRVAFRRGRVLGVAQVLRNDEHDDRPDVLRIASRLDERIRGVLDGSRCGYEGDPAEAVAAEQLMNMPLPKDQLPVRYAPFGDDVGIGRFQDNEEQLHTASLYVDDDRADHDRFGRVVGYAGAYSSDYADAPTHTTGFARTGVELFSDRDATSSALADAIEDERRLAGQVRGQLRIRAVSEFPVPAVGEEAFGLIRRASTGDAVIVVLRRGRLIGTVVLGPPGRDERMDEAITLARTLDERIQTTLRTH